MILALIVALIPLPAMAAGECNLSDNPTHAELIDCLNGKPPQHRNSFQDHRGQWWVIPMPPDRIFNQPYNGEIVPFYMSEADVTDVCSKATGKAETFGCSFPGPADCLIYITKELPPKLRAAIERHELAHCHGWGADHPEE